MTIAGPLLIAALLAVSVLHLASGAMPVPPGEVIAALFSYDSGNFSHVIVVKQRLTRLAVALYCGGALAVSGLLMQRVFRNGLVSPSTLGVNSGATAFVVLSVFFLGASGGALFLPALAGALLALALTFATAGLLRGQGDPRLNLVLAGSMVGVLFSSATTLVLSFDPDRFENVISWLIGDIGNFDYRELRLMAPLGAVAMAAALAVCRAIDLLALGDEQAAVMGGHVRLIAGSALGVALILSVSAVVVVGPIGFVGLILPHATRLIAGEFGRGPLLFCAGGGALAVTAADLAARTMAAPKVLNVGSVMGLAGGAAFLVLVLATARRVAR
ncbi:iron ABC transporter permease [Poseidonocella sp. HB161398]|uniref:FecCD family ABC transporter permease n=1 Tax=Poseidonocella sp. HB161398 TaxID=2320855 RepID=UPI001107F53D|nr:iron ABC transporter permease [Poseidonocella sp. HB161398]